MVIFSDIVNFLFGRKKQSKEIKNAQEHITPYKFYQQLADYAQSLGFTVAEGIYDSGFYSGTNYAQHGIQFKMYGRTVAAALNTYFRDDSASGIYYTSGRTTGEFSGPFTLTTLKMCKEDLDKLAVKLKENHQQLKLDSINEDFV